MVEQGAHEKDDAWIAKYRAALQDAPVKKSAFGGLLKAAKILSKKFSIAARRIRGQSVNEASHPAVLNGKLKKKAGAGRSDRIKRRKAG